MIRLCFTRYALTSMLFLGGCSLQPPYQAPNLAFPPGWTSGPGNLPAATEVAVDWWTQLQDPAINELVASALLNSPTLAQAAARVDEASAALQVSRAQRFPRLTGDGSITRGNSQGQSSGGSAAAGSDSTNITVSSLGPTLSWELDLWGRAESLEEASQLRLGARNADADDARLSLAAQIADSVLSLRACQYSLAIRDQDIASRETELALMRQRLTLGNVAPVDEANALSSLAGARTNRLSQQESCVRTENALVSLSGRDSTTIRELLEAPLQGGHRTVASTENPHQSEADPVIPNAPLSQPQLPAVVLLQHPAVRAAEKELAAYYAEIGAYRAERLPRVDLSLALAGQWIHALGATTYNDTWSVGSVVSMPIFDAGASAANVRGAEARYRGALANLQATLRTATQDVEDALTGQQSARQRLETSRQAVEAARLVMRSDEARYRLGAISLFELEGARRQLNSARESEIAAARDGASAWVALVRASGNALSGASQERGAALEISPSDHDTNGSDLE